MRASLLVAFGAIGLVTTAPPDCTVRPPAKHSAGELYLVDANGTEWPVVSADGLRAQFYMPEFNWIVPVNLIKPDDPRYEQPWQFTRIDEKPGSDAPVLDPTPFTYYADPDCQEPLGNELVDIDDCVDQVTNPPEWPDPSTLPWRPISPFGIYRPNHKRWLPYGQSEEREFAAVWAGECIVIEPPVTIPDDKTFCSFEEVDPIADWQGVPPEPYYLKFDRL